MQRHRVDVSVARAIRLELGSAAKLDQRRYGLLEPGECKAQRMMQAGILRGSADCRAQHAFSLTVAAQLPIKIGQVDGRGCVLRAEANASLILSFSLGKKATPREKTSQCGATFGPIGA
jgi:hypothetical protein